jgi:hypothetical protein
VKKELTIPGVATQKVAVPAGSGVAALLPTGNESADPTAREKTHHAEKPTTITATADGLKRRKKSPKRCGASFALSGESSNSIIFSYAVPSVAGNL